MAIAAGVAAVFNPVAVPVAMLGSTAPDWLEWVGALWRKGRPIEHRTVTHIVMYWIIGCIYFFMLPLPIDPHNFMLWFCVGGLSHVMADSLTRAGVPFGWWAGPRFHLAGGFIRTGQPTEYIIAWGFFGFCVLVSVMFSPFNMGFVPFFFDWPGYYNEGLMDGYEWKQNRFKFI